MASNNQIVVIGRVGHVIAESLKQLSNGRVVVEVRLAVPRYSKSTGDQEITDWIVCKFWDRQAEILAQYVQKGDLLSVTGALRVDQWESAEGLRRQRYYIQAENFQMLGRRHHKSISEPEETAINAA